MTSTARWKSAGLTSQVGANTVVIASLTHTSIGPSSCSVREAAASTWSNWLTSVGRHSARPPAAVYLGGRGLQARLAAGEQGDIESVVGEGADGGPADSRGRSGDHCHSAC